MAIPQLVTLPIPKDFSDHERFLVEKSEIALVDGLQLEQWSRDPKRKIEEFELDLKRTYKLKNRALAYFSDVQISGEKLSAVGVRQEVEFGKITGRHPEERLKDYVLNRFLNTAQWTYDDGAAGGFTFKEMLYCTADGKYGRYPDDRLIQFQPWPLIGTKYRWSLGTIYLHDFVVDLGLFKKTLSEAVSVVQHPDFVHIVENPRPGYKLEVAFGYPFIDYAPVPNNFGFGPGKFNWAIKTFMFLLRENNEVRCDMDFVAGKRPSKVFDFGKFIPCPIYGPADALDLFSLGLLKSKWTHDFMDKVMMEQHSRVHQALMEGTAKVFAAWLKHNEAHTAAATRG